MSSEFPIKFEDSTFDQTAQVVHTINSTMREKYGTWQRIAEAMKANAWLYMDQTDSTSMSTGGFELTAFNSSGRKHIRASVSAYAVAKYLVETQVWDQL
jgi:hypothetical protein